MDKPVSHSCSEIKRQKVAIRYPRVNLARIGSDDILKLPMDIRCDFKPSCNTVPLTGSNAMRFKLLYCDVRRTHTTATIQILSEANDGVRSATPTNSSGIITAVIHIDGHFTISKW